MYGEPAPELLNGFLAFVKTMQRCGTSVTVVTDARTYMRVYTICRTALCRLIIIIWSHRSLAVQLPPGSWCVYTRERVRSYCDDCDDIYKYNRYRFYYNIYNRWRFYFHYYYYSGWERRKKNQTYRKKRPTTVEVKKKEIYRKLIRSRLSWGKKTNFLRRLFFIIIHFYSNSNRVIVFVCGASVCVIYTKVIIMSR